MSAPIDLVNKNAEAAADTTVEMNAANGASLIKVPTRGHFHFTLTSIKDDAGAADVTLKGTNNPDPADATGETLITNSHTGTDQKDGSVANKGYAYVFVGATAGTFSAGGIKLHATGFAGSA